MTRDKTRTVKIITPGGLVLTLSDDQLPRGFDSNVVDETLARGLATSTGCRVTVESTNITTAEPGE